MEFFLPSVKIGARPESRHHSLSSKLRGQSLANLRRGHVDGHRRGSGDLNCEQVWRQSAQDQFLKEW